MAETVKVSLLHSVGYRASKDGEITKYPRGIVEMPLDQVKALGLTHRIQSRAHGAHDKGSGLAFEGAFDDRLAGDLTAAGFKTLADLRKATQSELMAVEGVGPAAYERIRSATGGTE